MRQDIKQKFTQTAAIICGVVKKVCIYLWRVLARIAHALYPLLQTFCESRKSISDLESQNALLNAQLKVAQEKAQMTDEEIQRLRTQLEDARGEAESACNDVNQILAELKRRAQGLAAKLKHNIMHSGSPPGVVIDQTVNQWYRDFKEWWDNHDEGEDDDEEEDEYDNEENEEEDDDDTGDDDYDSDEDEYEEEDDEEDDYDEDEDEESNDDEYEEDDDAEDNDDDEDGYDEESDDENDNEDDEYDNEYDDDDDAPEHEYDSTRKGSDLDQTFLETANDLFERLDELPKKCARFKVRFVSANSDNWLQPEEWHLGDDGSLIFGLIDDGNNHDDDELTIADLKDILTGGRDEGDFGVEEDSCLYVTDSGDYYRLLDEYFHIHWKYRIVDIPMIDDDTGDDEDDYDDDGYEDEDDDDEDDGGDKRDRGDDFAQQAASSLVLGLIMENGRRRHDGD